MPNSPSPGVGDEILWPGKDRAGRGAESLVKGNVDRVPEIGYLLE